MSITLVQTGVKRYLRDIPPFLSSEAVYARDDVHPEGGAFVCHPVAHVQLARVEAGKYETIVRLQDGRIVQHAERCLHS